ncbi:MAG: ribosome assembly RNA-binding protein YhbY [Treponema sp.]|nr:ribosome assembly RNA-binding protein YhbY [Treponema sp.]
MMEMTSAVRKDLSARAHNLHPVVIIGQGGLTDGVIGKISESLKAHELIKVKFLEFKDEKQELTQEIVEKTESQLVRIIGNIAILYKENEEKEDKKK